MAEQVKNKGGRPKKITPQPVIDESAEHLMMEKANGDSQKTSELTVENLSQKYLAMLNKYNQVSAASGRQSQQIIPTSYASNIFNPYIQNQRLKKLYSLPQGYDKQDLVDFVKDVGSYEQPLRSATQSLAGSTYVYYKILREAADIPAFKHYVIPENLKEEEYKKESFLQEMKLVEEWVEKFGIVPTFKRMALEIKKSGKEAYILRNSFNTDEKKKTVNYCQFQKMPTDYIKITYINELGFGCSFNMMYLCTPGVSPSQFPEYIQQAWNDMWAQGIVQRDTKNKNINFDPMKAKGYKPKYNNKSLSVMLENNSTSWAYWIMLPLEAGSFVFGSDMSTPYQAPDTAGMLLDLQNLTSYANVAGLLSTLPLNSLFTAEAEIVPSSGVGRTGTYVSADVLDGLNKEFDERIGNNGTILSYIAPLKNMKLHSLADSTASNSSEVLTSSLKNFLTRTGASATIISTDKPSIYQIKVATKLLVSQYDGVTRQFERALNYCLHELLGFKYKWTIKIFGDSLFLDDEKSFLKESVNGGATYLLPKLMACEDISFLEADAISKFINSSGIYKNFMTLTMLKNSELAVKAESKKEDAVESEEETKPVGRPRNEDSDNDNTEASQNRGDDVGEVKNEYFAANEEDHCLICHKKLDYNGQKICSECQEEFEIRIDETEE